MKLATNDPTFETTIEFASRDCIKATEERASELDIAYILANYWLTGDDEIPAAAAAYYTASTDDSTNRTMEQTIRATLAILEGATG